ncbi:MAG: WXG100 family type VII secretion target [Peptococcaceae bacterium]|nr:WXG100 family type VII secretion target [Peptococcaceae bacterium]
MAQFKVAPEQLVAVGKDIDGLATTYEDIRASLLDKATTMGSAWKGEDNAAFVERITECCTQLKTMVDKLKAAGETLCTQGGNYSGQRDSNTSQIKNLPTGS